MNMYNYKNEKGTPIRSMKLQVIPISEEANEFVINFHRHSKKTRVINIQLGLQMEKI